MDPIKMDDWLMKEVAAGNSESFRVLVERYQEYVLRIAYRFVNDQDEAEDIGQEVFYKLYLKRKKYKRQGKFRAFLARMTANESINRLRKLGRFKTMSLSTEQNLASTSLPVQVCETEELNHTLQTALEQLPLRQKLAFLLKVYTDLSYAEIGKTLSCSRTAVEGLVFRARQKLQLKLTHIISAEGTHGM